LHLAGLSTHSSIVNHVRTGPSVLSSCYRSFPSTHFKCSHNFLPPQIMFPQFSSILSSYSRNCLPPSRHFLAHFFHPVIVFPLFTSEATKAVTPICIPSTCSTATELNFSAPLTTVLRSFIWFGHSVQHSSEIVSQNMPQLLPFTSFPIYTDYYPVSGAM
jgi:hypothetical protein